MGDFLIPKLTTTTARSVASFVSLMMLAAIGCGSGSSTVGTGTPPLVYSATLSGTSLSFTTGVATTSAAQTLVLTNTGTGTLAIAPVSVTGTNASTFAQTNTCGTSLAVGGSCNIAITFTPTAAGSFTASLSISDNATASSQSATLNGTGTAPQLQLSSASLNFNTTLGMTAGPQTLVLTNSGNATLTFAGTAISGTNAGSFSQTSTCTTSLAPAASCNAIVSFTGTTVGTFAANLSITDNASGSPQSVALTAIVTGPVITLSSNALTFNTAAESTSAAQTVTLMNKGTATLTLSSLGLTGTNTASFAETNNCGTSIASGASCTITLTFVPFLATSYTASVGIVSNAIPAAQTIALSGTGTGTLSINTTSPTNWIITNGALTLNWNSTTGNVFGAQLVGTTDQLVDTTTLSSNGQPDGLYMDNVGPGAGTLTSGYSQVGNEYIDWWITVPSNSANAFTTTQHFVITANDTGFHIYSALGHSATDIAGSLGQWQYVFRISLPLFTETYSVNSGLGNLGVIDTPLPAYNLTGTSDPGRQVQNAVVDLHGLSLPTGFFREFDTKYDYSSYEYLHREHGIYGTKYGAWTIVPSSESLVAGPTKQDLIYTGNILIMEAYSNHLDNELTYTPPQGVASNRLFGPYYYHFNTFTSTNTTPAALYQEAQTWLPQFNSLYDADTTLAATNYIASAARGAVSATVANTGSAATNAAWTVLSDNAVNFQYSSTGREYWVNNTSAGVANLNGVVPGAYRLSSYVLGQWGEMRMNNVAVTANNTTSLPSLTFVPENFGTSTPIWTIGTPDRSGHEFLHGHDANGNDLRNYWGAYNFWADFASTNGAQNYYATAEGTTPATNNLNAINYEQWQTFDPGLFAGVYNSADDTTDGYNYAIPAYVSTLSGATGTNGVGTGLPPITIHFTTTAAQLAQGQYAVLSTALACAEGDIIATLNGSQLIWHASNKSDCMIRSGLSGYTQWVAMQWATSTLKVAGQDNVLTISSNQVYGMLLDAFRFEVTNTSADPLVTGWNDYEYIYGKTDTPANDALANP
jgi:hypothetical protein